MGDQHGFRFVVVVSSMDHSRRLRRVLHRYMKGHQTRVTVQSGATWYSIPTDGGKPTAGFALNLRNLRSIARRPVSSDFVSGPQPAGVAFSPCVLCSMTSLLNKEGLCP
jgi:hypothetical protein